MSETCEKAITILQKTNDGDDLDPLDLKLVELAVNDFLNDEGKQAFQKLFDDVNKGYVAPWFHGIENMLRTQQGYILWKGKQVEHYDSPWAYTPVGSKRPSLGKTMPSTIIRTRTGRRPSILR
jgi:ABC-type glycerol-3-phosphate transport system substrate-binding protein